MKPITIEHKGPRYGKRKLFVGAAYGPGVGNNKVYNYAVANSPPNYPMPALLQDSQSDLAIRWAHWLDDDRLSGHKY